MRDSYLPNALLPVFTALLGSAYSESLPLCRKSSDAAGLFVEVSGWQGPDACVELQTANLS